MKFPILSRLNVSSRLILPFLLILALAVAFALPYGMHIGHQLYWEKADKELITTSRVTSRYFGHEMSELLDRTRLTMGDETLVGAVAQGGGKRLAEVAVPLQSKLDCDFLLIFDASRKLLFSDCPREILEHLRACQTASACLSGSTTVNLDIAGKNFVILSGGPVASPGKPAVGYLVAGIILEKGFFAGIEGLMGHQLALLSLESPLILTNDPALGTELSRNRQISRQAGQTVLGDVTIAGSPYRMIVSDLAVGDRPRALLGVFTPMADISASETRMVRFLLTVALLGALFTVLFGLAVTRTITLPLRRLLVMTEEVGRGNLDIRMPEVTRDELGELACSFNRMAESLKVNLEDARRSKDEIARYALELEDSSMILRRDKKEIEAILQNMRDGLVLVDREMGVLAINPEALSILGVSQEPPPGTDFRELSRDFVARLGDTQPFQEILKFPVGAESGEFIREVAMRVPQHVIYRVKTYPVFEGEQCLLGWVITWTNITREKEVEDMKTNFMATISHELRTPLTSIKGSINLLLDGNLGVLTADQSEFIRIAGNNCERLISLVNNLLDLVRMEAGQLKTRKIECDLAPLVRRAVLGLQALAAVNRIGLAFSPQVSSSPVQADPERVIQIVTNLINNALKFSPPGSSIEVAVADKVIDGGDPRFMHLPTGDYFLVTVSDRGKGIPEDQLTKIFEKFYQIDMTTTRSAGGAGLGLAISRTIVREHGGTIWAEQRPGGGTSFCFLLPRHFAGNTDVRPV